jgi:hypothetical protein
MPIDPKELSDKVQMASRILHYWFGTGSGYNPELSPAMEALESSAIEIPVLLSILAADVRLRDAMDLSARLATAAKTYVDALDTCHICQGQVIIEAGPTHCENCSYHCEGHVGDDCSRLDTLHENLKQAIEAYEENNDESTNSEGND